MDRLIIINFLNKDYIHKKKDGKKIKLLSNLINV